MRQTSFLSQASVPLILRVFAGCYQPLLDRGPSRRYLCNPCMGAWTPYPAMPCWCFCSFLPSKLRPHPSRHKFGASESPCIADSTGGRISRLQSFSYVQAPTLARPPVSSHRIFHALCSSFPTSPRGLALVDLVTDTVCHHTPFLKDRQLGRLHHAVPGSLPAPSCGIATCLNRAINMTGLSPVGLQPCRPLRPPSALVAPYCRQAGRRN